jgi:hypothetical protein
MTPRSVSRRDLRLASVQEKEETYKLIDGLANLGITVSIEEHKSGFPAVTVDCGDVHILTDILSLEEWRAKQKKAK